MATTGAPSNDAVVSAADKLNKAVQDLVSLHATDEKNGSPTDDEAQRQNIIEAAQAVIHAVETHDHMWRDMGLRLSQYSAAQLFYEWKAFDAIPTEGSISYADLAAATGTEEALMRRAGAVLVATGLLKQIGEDNLACTYRSLGYRSDNLTSYAFYMTWYLGLVPVSRYPEYFQTYGRKEPQSVNHVPITFAAGKPELGYFEMLTQEPDRLYSFMKAMSAGESPFPITGVYSFSWLVDRIQAEGSEPPASEARVVLVDVGGGMGHAIKAIHSEYPQLPISRFVLQDTPETLEAGKAVNDAALSGIQRIPMNFHEEAPVQGAYTYWMRWTLHDYGDSICENILRHVASAMAPDSRLLIQEHVLQNPRTASNALSDWMVMAVGGKERSLDMWHKLVAAAGLKITLVAEPKAPYDKYPCFVLECVKV